MKKSILIILVIMTAFISIIFINKYIKYYKNLSEKYIEYKYMGPDKAKQKEGIRYFWGRELYESYALKSYILDNRISKANKDFVILAIGQTNKPYLRKVLWDLTDINDDMLRSDIVWCLGRYCDLSSQEYLDLIKIFKSEKNQLVKMKIEFALMGAQPGYRVKNFFQKEINDSDKKLNLIGRVAEYHFFPSPMTKSYIDAISRGNKGAKIILAISIGSLRDKKFAPYLEVLKNDSDGDVRKNALESIKLSRGAGLTIGMCK